MLINVDILIFKSFPYNFRMFLNKFIYLMIKTTKIDENTKEIANLKRKISIFSGLEHNSFETNNSGPFNKQKKNSIYSDILENNIHYNFSSEAIYSRFEKLNELNSFNMENVVVQREQDLPLDLCSTELNTTGFSAILKLPTKTAHVSLLPSNLENSSQQFAITQINTHENIDKNKTFSDYRRNDEHPINEKNQFAIKIVENSISQSNFSKNEHGKHISPLYESDKDEKNSILSLQQRDIHLIINTKKINCNQVLSRRTQYDRKFAIDRMSIQKKNLTFITSISSFFNLSQIPYKDNNIFSSVFLKNLDLFLMSQIQKIDPTMIEENPGKKRISSTQCKSGDKESYHNFCPFCPKHEYIEIESNKVENQFFFLFNNIVIRKDLKILFMNFFDQIFKMNEKPFSAALLFSSEFLKSQRMAFENLIIFFKSNSIILGQENRIKFLHSEYHELFMNNIDMKLFFLPELHSIIYVLMRPSSDLHISRYNRNFVTTFFSFLSLNEFFKWIQEFYEQNKASVNQSNPSFSRFVFQTISFIMRISFIELIFSLLSVHKNAQVKYHFLVTNIFYNELCIFLSKKNYYHAIAEKAKSFLPFIILAERFKIEKDINCFIEFDMLTNIKLNFLNFYTFKSFLEETKKSNIACLSNLSQELEDFLKISFV